MSCSGSSGLKCSAGCFKVPENRMFKNEACCPAPCCNPYPPCCFRIIPVKGCCPEVACRKPPFSCPNPCCPPKDPRCCVPRRCYSVSCPMCPPPPQCPPPCPRWYFKDQDLGPLRGVEYSRERPFFCPVCGPDMRFTQTYHLDRHTAKYHSSEVESTLTTDTRSSD